MVSEERDDEEKFRSDGSEYVPEDVHEVSPTRKQKTSSKKPEKHPELDDSSTESATPAIQSKSHLRKYIRLKGCYNDNYRKLFNTMVSEASHIAVDDDSEILNPMLNLPPSDLGGTRWSTEDKRVLYRAVARYGRDDLPRIASSLSKSEQEVCLYLDHVHKAVLQNTRGHHVGYRTTADEMHTAVEVSEDCLEELETCADALAWYQFTWEAKQEHKRHGDYWLLDKEVADKVEFALAGDQDDDTGSGRNSRPESGDSSPSDPAEDFASTVRKDTSHSRSTEIINAIPAAELLKLSSFISLSEKVFMNSKDPEWDWRSFQDAGKPDKIQSRLSRPEESPAIFRTAFDDFHRLVVDLTKRIMHTSLFLAASRLRAKDKVEQPLATDPRVEKRDVLGALQILKLKEDSFEHWATLPRRQRVDWYIQLEIDNRSKKLMTNAEEAERYLRQKGRIHHSEVESIFRTFAAEQNDEGSSVGDFENPSTSSPTRSLDPQELDDVYDQYLEMVDSQSDQVHEQHIWESLGKSMPCTTLRDLVEPKIPKEAPMIEQGTSSFADWRAWTERRAEWEMEEEEANTDDDNYGLGEEPESPKNQSLIWMSIPPSIQFHHGEAEHSFESVVGDAIGAANQVGGWNAIVTPGGSKRRRTESTTDMEPTFDVEMPVRKRHETRSPSKSDEFDKRLGDDPAWLRSVEPADDELQPNRSPSSPDSIADIGEIPLDDSE